MLSISFLDLVHNAINSIGFLKANLWLFGGVVVFVFIINFIPERTLVPSQNQADKSEKNHYDGGKDLKKSGREKSSVAYQNYWCQRELLITTWRSNVDCASKLCNSVELYMLETPGDL